MSAHDEGRLFHWTATTGLAECGQRLGHSRPVQQLGNSARGVVQVAQQYPALACEACVTAAAARLRARGVLDATGRFADR